MEHIQIFTVFGMFGVIWIVQIVQYPSFHHIEETQFSRFHQHHAAAISWIVLPLMVTELFAAVWLCFEPPSFNILWQYLLLVLTLMIWGSTFLVQVPLHRKLAAGKDPVLIEKLVTSNWVRTVAWTTKALLILTIMMR